MIFPELLPATLPIISSDLKRVDDFTAYRTLCDEYSGLMRIGIEDAESYDDLRAKQKGSVAIDGFVSDATNDQLGHVVDVSVMQDDRRISVVPRLILDSLLPQEVDVVRFEQHFLSDDLVTHILSEPDETTTGRITDELSKAVKPGERLVRGDGVPEFVFFNKFDTSSEACEYFKNNPPKDIITSKGFLVTSSREQILTRLPELAALQESVFSGNTLQVGYYGGLDQHGIEAIVNNLEFTPIAGFDPNTGEAMMFTLFSSNFNDFDALPWLNPQGIKKVLNSDPTKKTFAIPLIITSKANGLGLFNPAVQLAAHDGMYRQKPDTMYVTYESNGLSVLYTPRVIHRNLTNSLGFVHQGTAAEATFMTEADK